MANIQFSTVLNETRAEYTARRNARTAARARATRAKNLAARETKQKAAAPVAKNKRKASKGSVAVDSSSIDDLGVSSDDGNNATNNALATGRATTSKSGSKLNGDLGSHPDPEGSDTTSSGSDTSSDSDKTWRPSSTMASPRNKSPSVNKRNRSPKRILLRKDSKKARDEDFILTKGAGKRKRGRPVGSTRGKKIKLVKS